MCMDVQPYHLSEGLLLPGSASASGFSEDARGVPCAMGSYPIRLERGAIGVLEAIQVIENVIIS